MDPSSLFQSMYPRTCAGRATRPTRKLFIGADQQWNRDRMVDRREKERRGGGGNGELSKGTEERLFLMISRVRVPAFVPFR